MRKFFERYPVGSVLLLALVCLSPLMALRDVTAPNELRYLSIVDEALRDGHFFAFYNHGIPYADKPPLYFWLLMLCRLIFGRHCFYVPALLFSFVPASIITLVMDRWTYGKRTDVPRKERTTLGLLLFSTLYWLGLSFFLRMDMLLTMFIVLALYAWHRDKPWQFALFTFLGLFTKGLVGLLMPLLTVTVFVLSYRKRPSDEPRLRLFRFIGWRFLLLAGGCCAVWFFFAWLEGGPDYLHNLLFHQTVERTVNAFHHKRPFWYYLVYIWPVLLPWCFVVVPACVASLCRRGESAAPRANAGRAEKLFRCAFFSTFVMLSCSSSKLPVYLLPVTPFAVYLLPLYVRRTGWKQWMDGTLAAAAILFTLVGLALATLPLWYDKVPVTAPYTIARSAWFSLAGGVVACGGILTLLRIFHARAQLNAARPLAVSILLFFLCLSPILPEANEFMGYGALCRDIPSDVPVYVRGHNRPENMDVYLGRNVVIVGDDDPLPSDGVLVTKASFRDPALEGRECHIHGESAIWFPKTDKP